MTNYSKTTNFTAKDSLVSGDSNKIVRGAEIDTEFDNISTAVATKSDIASPTFTGVVSFPDGSAGNPSITNTGDTNSGLFFSAADTLAFTAAGTAQFTMADGVIAPVTDNDVDLGTSSLEFKDAYFDGTVHTDAINLDGTAITATAAELNIMDGVTSTAAELNILDGVTSTAAELNILDGVTSTAAELNILDGVTATATELNYSDTGAAVGTVVASKVVTADANKDVASFRNITLTGELDAGSLDISGDADIDGTLETDALSINGTAVTSTAAELNILDGKAFLDEDDMSSNSATGIASQQSIKAYVDAQITAEDLDVTSDSGTIAIDLDSETLTIAGGEGIDTSATSNTVTIAAEEATTSNKGVASFDSNDFTVSSGAVSLATTSTAAELNILDGATLSTSELNILDGVTSSTAELNILDGVTSTTAELNILDGVTSTTAELNILDGVTSTAAELNILDGVTATTAELNILDGVTSTAAELNILDGKAFLDEDDMSSNSATGIASQQSIKAYVDAQITAEDLDFQADSGGALSIDLDSETLTFTGGTGIDTSGSGNAVTFAIDSTVATLTGSQTLTNKSLTAPTLTGTAVVASLDISGDIDVDGTTNLDVVDIDGAVDMASTLTVAGVVDITDTTDSSDATGDTGALRTEGGASIAKKLYVGTDLDVDGTTNLDVVDIDGAVDMASTLQLSGGDMNLVCASGGGDQTINFRNSGNTIIQQIHYDDSDGSLSFGGPSGGNFPLKFQVDDVNVSDGERFRLTKAEAVFNEPSNDTDFRVESNGNANAILVDAGNDRVGILNDGTMGSNFNVLTQMSLGADNNNRAILDFSSSAFTIGTIESGTAFFSGFKMSGGAMTFDGKAGTSPIFHLVNNDNEDTDTGRETTIRFNGHRSGGEDVINGQISGHHHGSADDDDGMMMFSVNTGAAVVEHLRITPFNVVVNDASNAHDFRVEADANSHLLFADSSELAVRIKSTIDLLGSSESFTVQGQVGIVAPDSGVLHASTVSSGTAILSRFYYNSGSTEVGRITTDGSTTTFVSNISDAREKKNFESWDENVLPHFKTLNPQRFHFSYEEDDSEKQKGYIAQDLVDAFPEAYPLQKFGKEGEEKEERYHFNPSGMVVYLMKAIQEQQAQIETLEAKVNALQGG